MCGPQIQCSSFPPLSAMPSLLFGWLPQFFRISISRFLSPEAPLEPASSSKSGLDPHCHVQWYLCLPYGLPYLFFRMHKVSNWGLILLCSLQSFHSLDALSLTVHANFCSTKSCLCAFLGHYLLSPFLSGPWRQTKASCFLEFPGGPGELGGNTGYGLKSHL